MATDIAAAWIGAGSTFVAALLGVGAIYFQLGRQGDLNRTSIEEAERRRLKAKMYDEVESACTHLIEVQAAFHSKLVLAVQEIEFAAGVHARGEPFIPPQSRVMVLHQLSGDFQDAVIKMITLVEQRQFIAPDMLVFCSAFSSTLHDVREKFTRRFFPVAMHFLPTDRPDDLGIFEYAPPSPAQAAQLTALAMEIGEALTDATAYASDFSIEMQRLLLSDLFRTSPGRRSPIDTDRRVISLENARELQEYFQTETDWGRMCAEEETKARARLAERSTGAAVAER